MKERTAQSLYRPTYKTTIKVCSQRQKASQYDSLNITVWASWVVMAKAGPASTPLPPPSALTRVKSIKSAWPGQWYIIINYNKPTAGPFKCTSSTLGQILNGAGHTRLDYHWKKSMQWQNYFSPLWLHLCKAGQLIYEVFKTLDLLLESLSTRAYYLWN